MAQKYPAPTWLVDACTTLVRAPKAPNFRQHARVIIGWHTSMKSKSSVSSLSLCCINMAGLKSSSYYVPMAGLSTTCWAHHGPHGSQGWARHVCIIRLVARINHMAGHYMARIILLLAGDNMNDHHANSKHLRISFSLLHEPYLAKPLG